jgi:hypothetical protein
MHPVVRTCLLFAVELGVLLTGGVMACLRGRRLLCVALLIMALCPLLTIVLEIVTNTVQPLKVPQYAIMIRLPFYFRMLGGIVLLSAIIRLAKDDGIGDTDAS